jgi:hypothetical protein
MMTSSATTSQTVTVVHSALLLAEPKFGSHALALLSSGDSVASNGYVEGFLRVPCGDGREGFLPAAVCEPLATKADRGAHLATQVFQPVWLHRRVPPGGYIASPWIVSPQEPLLVLGREKKFLHIQRPDGQIGYVPELLCEKVVQPVGGQPATRLRQPIALYSYPAPGGQFSSDRIISPKEQLLVLGGDSDFLLVQREDGRIGYVPAALCGAAAPDAILRAGPLDLGWMGIGIIWALPNLGILLLALRNTWLVDSALRPYVGIGIALAVAATFYFASRRRMASRSFALGVLLAYALIHTDSGGALTFWR